MKTATTFTLAILFISSAIAQPFSEREYLSSTPFPIFNSALIDLEGDGDLDALVGGVIFHSSGIEVWVNNDGDFELSTSPIPFGKFGSQHFAVGDIDLDGDEDFAAIIEGTLAWFANDGSGTFASPTTIATNIDPTSNIALDNLDNLPGLEIAIGQESTTGGDPELLIYENDGDGNFGPGLPIPGNGAFRPGKIEISDINADGLNDLVVTFWGNSKIAIYLNNGGLSFSGPGTINTVQSGLVASVVHTVADFDADGYPDIASLTPAGLSVYMNTGNQSFGPATPIIGSDLGSSGLEVGDFNNDGIPDICAISFNVPYLYVNDGNANFTEVAILSAGTVTGVRNQMPGDVDGDGRTDLVTASFVDNKLALFKQASVDVPFGENPFENNQVLINNPASGVKSIASGDVDGDGLNDLISAEHFSGDVTLYRNLSDGGLGKREVILDLSEGLSGVAVQDMNGDGEVDVVVTNEDEGSLTLYLNQGDGSSFTSVPVDQDIALPYEPFLSDLDNDGDFDILQASGGSAQVLIYPNNGDGSFGASIVLCDDCSLSEAISAKDLNGDNLPEVLVSASQNQEILIYSNLGDLTFGTAAVLMTSVSQAKDIEYVDFDNDGDQDVFVAAWGESYIRYAENLGNLDFSPTADVPISLLWADPNDLAVLDIDLDGDMDLALTEYGRSRVSIITIENGTFEKQPIDTPYNYPTLLLAEDFTNDGKVDLVAGFVNNLVLYTNLAGACSSFRPSNLDVEISMNSAIFTWDPVPESVGCRILFLDGNSQWVPLNIIGFEVSSYTIPVDNIQYLFYKVQCACSTNPLELTQPSALGYIDLTPELEVFPNPAQEDLQVKFGSNTDISGMPYRVMDIQGRILMEGLYQNRINLNALEAGQYLIEMDGTVARFFKK